MSGKTELLRCRQCGAEPKVRGDEQMGYKLFCSASSIHNSGGCWFRNRERAEADWNRRQEELERTLHPDNLGELLQPCPFCGRKMKFFREESVNREGGESVHQYYMHDVPEGENNDNCVLDMIEFPFVIPAGDARPEEGYIGECAEKWNSRAFIMLPKTNVKKK